MSQQQLSSGSDQIPEASAEILVSQLRAANNAVQGPGAPSYSDDDYQRLTAKLEKHFRRFRRLRKSTGH